MTGRSVRTLRTMMTMLMTAAGAVSLASLPPAISPAASTRANVQLAGSSVIYVQGSLPCCGVKDLPISNIFRGEYGNGTVSPYPRTIGLLNGIGAPTTDKSVAQGVPVLDALLKSAKEADPNGNITVVSLSQGTIVASYELTNLQREGYDASGMTFIMAGDPVRPNGGLGARLPVAVWIPLMGVQGGYATPSTDATVIMITKQYDPWADAPQYLGNPVADANELMSFVTTAVGDQYDRHNYNAADPNDPTAIVTQSGNMTDKLIPVPVGDLPLTVPLKGIVPQKYIDAADPALRAMIETGYNRNADPAVRAPFGVLPPVSQWKSDVESINEGVKQSAEQFTAALKSDLPKPPSTSAAQPASKPAAKLLGQAKHDVDKTVKAVTDGLKPPTRPKLGGRDGLSPVRKLSDSISKQLKLKAGS